MKQPPKLTRASQDLINKFDEAAQMLGVGIARHADSQQPFPPDADYNAAKLALEKRVRWLECNNKRLRQVLKRTSKVLKRVR